MAKTTKTTPELDTTKFVAVLTEAGFTDADAKKSVTTLVDAVNKEMGDEPVAIRTNIIMKKLRSKARASKMTTQRSTILFVGERTDGNDFKRSSALKMYKEAPEAALSQGLIKLLTIKGETVPTPVDNRTTLDKAGKWENRGYGKPWGVNMSRQLLLITDGQIVRAYADINVDVGGVYDIYGKVNEASGIFYPASDPSPVFIKKLSQIELYNEVYEAAKTSDYAFDVYGATETDDKGTVIVKGYVQSVGTTGSGNGKIRINDDSGAAITAFSNNAALSETIQRITVASEVMVIGKIRDSTNPEFGRSINGLGVIVNPQSSVAVSGAMDKLKDLEF